MIVPSWCPQKRVNIIHLRYHIHDNHAVGLSNAEIAAALGISEGTVSVMMRQLAGETITYGKKRVVIAQGCVPAFIERWHAEDVGNGSPGYVTRMLPPPELRMHTTTLPPPPPPTITPPPTVAGDLHTDPLPHAAIMPSARHEVPHRGDLHTDPPFIIEHAVIDQQQQGAPAHAEKTDRTAQETPPPLLAPPPPVDADAPPPDLPVTFWTVWPKMCRGTPGYSHARFRADLDRILTRPQLRENPTRAIATLCRAVIDGQPVYSASDIARRAARYLAPHIARQQSAAPTGVATGDHTHAKAGTIDDAAVQRGGGSPAHLDRTPRRATSAGNGGDATPCGIPSTPPPADIPGMDPDQLARKFAKLRALLVARGHIDAAD